MIIQLCKKLYYGDGVGKVILSIDKILKEQGLSCLIALNEIDPRCDDKDVFLWNELKDIKITNDDIILYHFSTGSYLNYEVECMKCKKILIFHNTTPPQFFRGIDQYTYAYCSAAMLDIKSTVGRYLHAIVLSEFSKNDLIRNGWNSNSVTTIPLTTNTTKALSNSSSSPINDDEFSFLFVGRVAPNKKIEDLIKIFAYYQKNFNANCKLTIVGMIGFRNYYKALINYAESLNVKKLYFKSFVSGSELNNLYESADLFLCMSEHEGFCIPLVEAMEHEIPVVAYSATAVKDTLSYAGVLVESKEDKEVCAVIDQIFSDDSYRKKILDSQKKRLVQLDLGASDNASKLIEVIRRVEEVKDFNYMGISDEFRDCFLNKQNSLGKNDVLLDYELYWRDGPIVLVGINDAGKELYDELLETAVKISYICESNIELNEYLGNKVYSIKECVCSHPNALFIIAQDNKIELAKVIIELGVREDQIFYYERYKREVSKIPDGHIFATYGD